MSVYGIFSKWCFGQSLRFSCLILLVAFLKISEVFVPNSRYVGDAAFAEDRRLCLKMRPDSELFDCLSEYGWFEKSSVSKLGD